MRHPRLILGAAVAGCAVGGAVATSAASPSGSSSQVPPPPPPIAGSAGQVTAVAGPGGFKRSVIAGPPVHSEAVVPNRDGTGFDTLTTDSGRFRSLSGDRLTIAEGTGKATYATPTLTIPAGATVRRNDAVAQLSDLRSGDEVTVMRGPEGTTVDAADAAHRDRGVVVFRSKGGEVRRFDAGPPPAGMPPLPKGPPPAGIATEQVAP